MPRSSGCYVQHVDKRPAVPVDDKVVAVWNGYMMTTLALAGRLLDEPRYIKAAEAHGHLCTGQLFDSRAGVCCIGTGVTVNVVCRRSVKTMPVLRKDCWRSTG